MSDNLSVVLVAANEIRLENRSVPVPKKGEVLMRMTSVGICGSDVHYYTNMAIGHFVVKAPMVLGHESAGVVEKVGEGVTHLKPGDRVAIEPGVPCRICDYCKEGRYNLCPDVAFLATPPVDGSLCRYYAHAADFCFKLPKNMSLEEGALMEPLAVAVHACTRANVTIGKTVLVCGAGPIGIVNLLTAKAMGASKVVVTDISESRLKFAASLGADATYLVQKDAKAEQMADEISSGFFSGDRADISIDCSGAESSVRLGIFGTRAGGVLVLVGLGGNEVSVPLVNAACREVDIRGIFRYANCYPKAIELVSSGRINVKPLITHRFQLEETVKAFETAKSGAAIKVMIKCGQE